MIPLRDSIESRRSPTVNYTLISANIGAFLYEISLPHPVLEDFIFRWGAIPARFNPEYFPISDMVAQSPTLITSIFLHGGPAHLIGNMLFLYIFGDNVEDLLGRARYLIFYLACGIAASAAQLMLDLTSEIPVIGASGAIGGVMGAYLIFFPHARVLTVFWVFVFIRFIWIPALVYLGIWFLIQLLSAMTPNPMTEQAGGGIAFWAHVGGFVSGAVLGPVLKPRPRRGRGASPRK